MMKQNRQGFPLKRCGLSLLFLALLLGLLVSGCGGEETKTYRVGVLVGLPFLTDMEAGFKEGMAELGYVEGENIVYDVQTTDFDIATYQSILQQFIDDEVDLIFVGPTEAAIEAKTITAGTDIPVVFSFVLVEGMGIIDTVQEPGNNITGVRYPGPDLAALRYEMLRDMVPNLENIVIPYQAGYPNVQPQLDAIYSVAEADGVTVIEVPANNPEELAAYFNGLSDADAASISAVLAMAEPLITIPDTFTVLADFAEGRQIPIAGFYANSDSYASIFGVTVHFGLSGELAAPLADKIFQGFEPGTIPVVSADPYIEVDYNMLQRLGLEVPDTLLAIADQVYR